MSHRLKARLTLALLLIALVGLAALTYAANVVNQKGTFAQTLYDDCTGEDVAVTGKFHLLVHQTVDGAGGYHVDVMSNFPDVRGVGLSSGLQYNGNQATHFGFNATAGGTVNQTNPLTFHLNGHGSAPNLVLHALLHVTINAKGQVTAFVDHMTSDCRG